VLTGSGNRETTAAVIAAGAIPALVETLDTDSAPVCAQVACALGNIARHAPGFRDDVVRASAVRKLCAVRFAFVWLLFVAMAST